MWTKYPTHQVVRALGPEIIRCSNPVPSYPFSALSQVYFLWDGCMGYYTFGESNIDIGEDDAELGYWIARPYWNLGLCTEALSAMVAWCFNVKGFQVLWSDFFVDNPASGRVMEKCGFRDTGKVNWCSHLYRGDERPVKVMRLDYALD